jgi:hypothetical protein
MSTYSPYPTDPKLTALVQEWGNASTGFVHQCLFPEVNALGCKFKWIDWKNTLNQKIVDTRVGACSNVHEIKPSSFEWKYGETEDEALDMPVCYECNTFCGELPFDLEAMKAKELYDRIILGREKQAIDLAFDQTAYAAATNQDPGNVANIEAGGMKFDLNALHAGGVNNTTASIMKYFQDVQIKRRFKANVAVMNLAVYYALKRHPNFLGKNNCCDPLVGDQELAALLGVQRICIGDAYYDQAAAGLPVSESKFLGSSILLVHNSLMGMGATTTETPKRIFGFAAVEKQQVGMKLPDMHLGAFGGYRIRVAARRKAIVADYSMATLIQNAI